MSIVVNALMTDLGKKNGRVVRLCIINSSVVLFIRLLSLFPLFLLILHSLRHPHEDEVEHRASDESGDGVDGIVGLDIYRGEAEQHIEGSHNIEQLSVAGVPYQ